MEKYNSPSDTLGPGERLLIQLNKDWKQQVLQEVKPTLYSYVNFKRRMKTLKRFLEETNRLECLMQGLDEYNQKPCFAGYLSDEYVKMLADNIGDTEGLISLYIWDNNWGKSGEIDSIKKLYKAIIHE